MRIIALLIFVLTAMPVIAFAEPECADGRECSPEGSAMHTGILLVEKQKKVEPLLASKHEEPVKPVSAQNYYFDRKPYVHPFIVRDLTTWLSDKGEQVVSINLNESAETNRYFGELKIKTGANENPSVSAAHNEEWYEYKLIGKTANGIYALLTTGNGGGTGYFRQILFVRLRADLGLKYDKNTATMKMTRARALIEKLGSFTLGDRYIGDLKIEGNSIFIGKDTNNISQFIKEDFWVNIE